MRPRNGNRPLPGTQPPGPQPHPLPEPVSPHPQPPPPPGAYGWRRERGLETRSRGSGARGGAGAVAGTSRSLRICSNPPQGTSTTRSNLWPALRCVLPRLSVLPSWWARSTRSPAPRCLAHRKHGSASCRSPTAEVRGAHRDDEHKTQRRFPSALLKKTHRIEEPDALKISARKAEHPPRRAPLSISRTRFTSTSISSSPEVRQHPPSNDASRVPTMAHCSANAYSRLALGYHSRRGSSIVSFTRPEPAQSTHPQRSASPCTAADSGGSPRPHHTPRHVLRVPGQCHDERLQNGGTVPRRENERRG